MTVFLALLPFYCVLLAVGLLGAINAWDNRGPSKKDRERKRQRDEERARNSGFYLPAGGTVTPCRGMPLD